VSKVKRKKEDNPNKVQDEKCYPQPTLGVNAFGNRLPQKRGRKLREKSERRLQRNDIYSDG
jgi:hypothetical protein